MADVKRSVVITAEQDAFATDYRRRLGLSRSQVVRLALDKLMNDPPFFVPASLAQSKDTVDDQRDRIKP